MKKSTILAMLVYFRSTGSGEVSARRCAGLRCVQYALWLVGALLCVVSAAQAGLKGGDILVLEQGGVVFVVHPTTGHRRVLTDLRNLAQGCLGTTAATRRRGKARGGVDHRAGHFYTRGKGPCPPGPAQA